MNYPLPVTSHWNLNFIYDYYGWLLCAMIKSWPQETWREKGLLHLTGQSPSSREAKLGTQAGTWMQEIKQRPWRNTTYWIIKLPFLNIPDLHMQESLYPQGSGLSHNNQQLRKCPIYKPVGRCDGRNSLNEIPSSQACLGLCQVNKNEQWQILYQ